MEKAVEAAVDGGFEMIVDTLDNAGGRLNVEVDLGLSFWMIGDGLSGDVDIDKDRRLLPKLCNGESGGDAANAVCFIGLFEETIFFTVVTANGEIASIMA